MATEKTSAIVLRVVEFSESSCVVTLFTEDFGKVGALAKGARRPKGPFDSALDLLAVCRIVFIHKSSEGLDLLTEARLERRFRSATRDLSRLYAGYYVAELLQDLTDLGDPHPDLYREADRTLLDLDHDGDVAMSVLRFEIAALRLLGYLPAVDHCCACGRPAAETGRVLFGLLGVVSLSPPVLALLRSLAGAEAVAEPVAAPPPNRRALGELRGLLNRYLTNLLGRQPRMHKYLGFLVN